MSHMDRTFDQEIGVTAFSARPIHDFDRLISNSSPGFHLLEAKLSCTKSQHNLNLIVPNFFQILNIAAQENEATESLSSQEKATEN